MYMSIIVGLIIPLSLPSFLHSVIALQSTGSRMATLPSKSVCAIQRKDIQSLEHALHQGDNPNEIYCGQSLLSLALSTKAPQEYIELLINYNANLNDTSGVNFPLQIAARHNNLDALQLLIYHSAHVDTYNRNQTTALMEAAAHGSIESALMLITEFNADKTIRNHEGCIAQDIARLKKHTELADLIEATTYIPLVKNAAFNPS